MKILITGISGQDAACLSQIALSKGNEVHGTYRRSSNGSSNLKRVSDYLDKIHLHEMDLLDGGSVDTVIKNVLPDVIFNLAAQSHVGTSFIEEEYTYQVNQLGFYRIMKSLQSNKLYNIKIYQASTSEMFGVSPAKQSETTLMQPNSPYAIAKKAAYDMVQYYRRLGFQTYSGILFNHEQPGSRGEDFVTRKIAMWAAKANKALKDGKEPEILKLGNMEAQRDWGLAYEYCEVMYRMVTELDPVDLVIATGETHSVLEFWIEACKVTGVSHIAPSYLKAFDNNLLRGTGGKGEVPVLCGDATKAKQLLGWEPKVKFKELVKLMVEAEMKALGV